MMACYSMTVVTRGDDFYEDDEPVAKIVELFERGPTFQTSPSAARPLSVAPRYERPDRDRFVHGDELARPGHSVAGTVA
jgi:hypothetical protein